MTEATVLYETRGAVALITLNRPAGAQQLHARRCTTNSGPRSTAIEADKSIRARGASPAPAAVSAPAPTWPSSISSPARTWSSAPTPGPVIEQAFNPTVRRLQALRVPTVAAVNGVAAGAGASLAMTCDLAVAASGASFIQAFSKIGLVPDAGGSWFLVKKLGLARAHGLRDAGRQGQREGRQGVGDDLGRRARRRGLRRGRDEAGAAAGRHADHRRWSQTRKLLRAAASNELDAQLDRSATRSRRWARRTTTSRASWPSAKSAPPQFKGE